MTGCCCEEDCDCDKKEDCDKSVSSSSNEEE